MDKLRDKLVKLVECVQEVISALDEICVPPKEPEKSCPSPPVSVKGCDVLHRDVLDAHNPSVSHGPESQKGGSSELTGSPAPLNRLGLAVGDGAFLRYEDPQAGAGDVVLPASGAQPAPATPNGHGTRRTTTHQVCGQESRDLRAVPHLTAVTLVAAEGKDWRDAVLRLCSAVNELDIALDHVFCSTPTSKVKSVDPDETYFEAGQVQDFDQSADQNDHESNAEVAQVETSSPVFQINRVGLRKLRQRGALTPSSG
ncbi:hypothetical protein ONE63_011499 [Megalurothrips usitatus]|uniref:Uncharacterized protein n=1 Tax=Megalurothrips usitatus TaxID=439358 RepID=A0AAV7X5D9_9NEOP|nr:hypothetical protein ONE63_011499 [Megalurothrips usitatus]